MQCRSYGTKITITLVMVRINDYIEYMYHEGYDYQYMIVENNPDMLQDYRNGGHTILTETDHYAVVKTVRSAEKDD